MITRFTIAVVFILATSAYAGPVPDTGVTKCYNAISEIPCPTAGQPFYGQDANYSINPRSYTIIDSIMVKDNVTGLVWELKNSKDGTKNYANLHDADNTYTWYDSNPATNGGNAGTAGDGTDTEDFIKALNNANFGGYSDWRLPTIKELAGIADRGRYNPAIDTNHFKDTIASFYWSSSTNAFNINDAWSVHFDNGYGYYDNKDNGNYVRAVRGGQ